LPQVVSSELQVEDLSEYEGKGSAGLGISGVRGFL